MNIIEVEELSKNFGQLTAVDKVSFQVAEGEIFGFLGPNGAGKTTTINMLGTLLTPTGGRATVNGYDVLKQRSEVRRSIGLVFQEPTLDEYLTAEQNLRFHDARHTHASLMLKQGIHPKIVQEGLGHASIQMTLDTYSHVAPGLQEAAAVSFDNLVNNSGSKWVANSQLVK